MRVVPATGWPLRMRCTTPVPDGNCSPEAKVVPGRSTTSRSGPERVSSW